MSLYDSAILSLPLFDAFPCPVDRNTKGVEDGWETGLEADGGRLVKKAKRRNSSSRQSKGTSAFISI